MESDTLKTFVAFGDTSLTTSLLSTECVKRDAFFRVSFDHFWGSWGSRKNWPKPKTKLPYANLTKLCFSKSVKRSVGVWCYLTGSFLNSSCLNSWNKDKIICLELIYINIYLSILKPSCHVPIHIFRMASNFKLSHPALSVYCGVFLKCLSWFRQPM